MAGAKQERLPLREFKDLDDAGAILLRGLQRYRQRYDSDFSWPDSIVEDCLRYKPEQEVPRLAEDVAAEAPANHPLSDPKHVHQLFNILAFSEGVEPQYARIPYTPLDNRGDL